MEELFDCAVALGEATFYHSLGRIAHSNHSKEAILRLVGNIHAHRRSRLLHVAPATCHLQLCVQT